MSKLRFILMPLVVTAVILLQMAMPVIVRADDGTPPPDQPTEVATDPGTATTEAIPPTDSATPASTDSATPASTDAAAPAVASLLSEVPDGTQVVVVNPDGTTEPLATQAAADAIATGDPVWCPTSIGAPTPGSNGCTGSYGNLSLLVASLPDQSSDGTIWIQAGPDTSASPVTIDGNNFTHLLNYALTLQGGWSGTSGDATVDLSTPSVFSVPISVINWGKNVTADDLNIILPTATPGPYGFGLEVGTTGDISVSNIAASGAVIDGAYLANDVGTGNVSVTNSNFSDNSGTGLEVRTTGTINVDTVTASNNTSGSGANLNADKQIDISNSTFSNNAFDGVYAGTSSGNVNLTSVDASSNQYGAIVGTDNGNVQVTDSTFTQNATVDGQGIGLQAGTSSGNVTLTNVTASLNDIGAVAGTENGNILVVGGATGNFSTNHAIGLEAGSASGDVTLTNVIASANGTVDTDGIGALVGTLDGVITINGGTFDNNAYKGMYIESTGTALNPDVTLSNVNASNNGVKGVYIEYLAPCGGTGGVTIDVVGGLYQSNGAFGIYAGVGPAGSLVLDSGTPPGFGLHNGTPPDSLYDYVVNTDVSTCPQPEPEPEPKPEEKPYNVIDVPETGGAPVAQNCTDYSGTVLVLPGDDKATLNCPATGELTLQSLVEGGLPGSLPSGPAFVSALQFGLKDGDQPVTVLPNGASLKLAFKLPEDAKASDHFAILYWDPSINGSAGGWVELPAFAAHLDGTPLVFALHPHADPDDLMRILSGVHQLGGYVKATVNFPGVFVLVKK